MIKMSADYWGDERKELTRSKIFLLALNACYIFCISYFLVLNCFKMYS